MWKLKYAGSTLFVCVAALVMPLSAGQQAGAPGVPASIVVTLEPKHGKTIPAIEAQDITVRQGRDKQPVMNLQPIGEAPMQLALLIDDSARSSFGTELSSIKTFIASLPPNVEIAVGYMRNGAVQYAQNFTRDHAAAANSIRLAMGPGGADVSPYDSLSEAIKQWPQTPAQRREVIMISSGIEALGGGYAPDNPYVNVGIQDAQKAGIVVYAIYNPSVGHWGHSYWRTNWGQNFLSQLSDETGGEAYNLMSGSAVSFDPFFQQILQQFRNQYLLTFEAKPEGKAGLQPIHVAIAEKDASVAAPDRVYVRAGM